MSVTRFADAINALLAAYTAAPALAGVPVSDGTTPIPQGGPDFIIVGHDATTDANGTLQASALAGIYAQDWADTTTGRDERGSVNCLIASQSPDITDLAGRRARVTVLLAACEDAALGQASHLSFDGITDGRWLYRSGAAGAVVICAYRVAYSAPWG